MIIKLKQEIIDQIAAGEIIQRPSFVLKELMENAIDAKATNIQVKIEKAGKKMIQVLDNGIGMSENDCTLCFQKHATSKIKTYNDLWDIKTLGFRGEALHAIASVSRTELISKEKSSEIGNKIIIESGDIKSKEKYNFNQGTMISVKNLFYNTPARRKFLKSESAENRKITNTFISIAMANEQINFSLQIDDKKIFDLKKNNQRQRINSLIRKNTNKQIIPIKENTEIITIKGFVGKPDFAKKNKLDQYIFLNKRHIKNKHISKSIESAYEGLIKDSYPIYFIFLEVNPEKVDVNIHPTKHEVNFEDEKNINKIIHAAVKKSLGQYNISNSFNFEQEQAFNVKRKDIKTISFPSSFNKSQKTETIKSFEEIYNVSIEHEEQNQQLRLIQEDNKIKKRDVSQIKNKFIVVSDSEKITIIHQSRAHQRILYEHFKYNTEEIKSQKMLYPEKIEISYEEFIIISQIKDELEKLGFNIKSLKENEIEINGTPNDNREYNIKFIIEELITNFKETGIKNINIKDQIANLLSKQMAIKSGQTLEKEEMKIIVEEILNCSSNKVNTEGKKIMTEIDIKEISSKF